MSSRGWPPGRDEAPLHRAHDYSSSHRAEVLASALCACFYCLATYPPPDIVDWIGDDEAGVGQTAICPKCGVDSVLGEKAGFPLTREFLEKILDSNSQIPVGQDGSRVANWIRMDEDSHHQRWRSTSGA